MPASPSQLEIQPHADGLRYVLSGALDVRSVGPLWSQAGESALRGIVTVDAASLEYCDGAGIAWIIWLEQQCRERGAEFEFTGASAEIGRLYEQYEGTKPLRRPRTPIQLGLFETVGNVTASVLADIRDQLTFVGALTVSLGAALARPLRLRWSDLLRTVETAGVNALGIVGIISFLMGLILSFQSAIPMQRFGAELFVADLVAISLLRELGPLMTAIVLTGRTGSSFAAELGTMKVNEEVDALTTMGIDPVRFLVVPRVLAAVITTPMLALFANFCGLLGSALVMLSLGFPLVTFVNQVVGAVSAVDLLGGLFKAFVFGIIVAAIGCQQGLRTGSGASAVGQSTTRSVVSGILLIVVVDGAFSGVYYALGI